eukprot:CAMPEP_0204823798 /NCGR_PEP_ID=MMETSP1346-20131115/1865_1 /ASSEMBLY_ACC=CAM_ASM_000771 /TAXON_ID=215587 /ORGANISM="Aplanochytrium stocchinoi, Strain GSBS06" /LENGTH=341 /DNA_ID=CAMNT_0051950593 /DNA_START=62 /DNA_END=1087 /DNA_ORIENTATION=+
MEYLQVGFENLSSSFETFSLSSPGSGSPPKWQYGKERPKFDLEGNLELGEMINSDGLRLTTYFWPASCPHTEVRGQVIGFHGMGTHVRYEYLKHVSYEKDKDTFKATYHEPTFEDSWIHNIVDAGYNFHSFEHQSMGLSEGKNGLRGYFDEFEDLVDDAIAMCRKIMEQFQGPIFLIGPSLGGCIAARVVQELDFIDGCILLAPMLSLEQLKQDRMNQLLLPIAGCLQSIAPTLRLASEAENNMFPQESEYLRNDILCDHTTVRLRVGWECLIGVENARNAVEKITCPILIFHSSNDTMVDPEGSEFFFNNCNSTEKEYVVLDSGISWHALILGMYIVFRI